MIIRLLYNYFAIMIISFRVVDIGIFTLNMKGYLLYRERLSFALQKVAYCNAICHLLVYSRNYTAK